MSRDDGFAIMDVSTDLLNDPKWRRMHRRTPELIPAAFMAYAATLAESWRSGQRVSVEEAWPVLLPYDEAVIAALRTARLLDKRGLIPVEAWRNWFEVARNRREKSRERWRRHNANRDADTALVPRGSDAGTTTSVPLLPSVPSVPTVRTVPPARAREEERRPRGGEMLRASVVLDGLRR
jgi:hypothetical protein